MFCLLDSVSPFTKFVVVFRQNGILEMISASTWELHSVESHPHLSTNGVRIILSVWVNSVRIGILSRSQPMTIVNTTRILFPLNFLNANSKSFLQFLIDRIFWKVIKRLRWDSHSRNWNWTKIWFDINERDLCSFILTVSHCWSSTSGWWPRHSTIQRMVHQRML
jgi:hypothetical protein